MPSFSLHLYPLSLSLSLSLTSSSIYLSLSLSLQSSPPSLSLSISLHPTLVGPCHHRARTAASELMQWRKAEEQSRRRGAHMKMYFVLVRRNSKRIGGRDPMAWNGPPSRLTSHGACELEVALGVEDRRVRRLSARRACVILQKKRRFANPQNRNLGILWIHQPQGR